MQASFPNACRVIPAITCTSSNFPQYIYVQAEHAVGIENIDCATICNYIIPDNNIGKWWDDHSDMKQSIFFCNFPARRPFVNDVSPN